MGDCSKNVHVGCGSVKLVPTQEEMRRRGWKEDVCYTHGSERGASAGHAGPQGKALVSVRRQKITARGKPVPEPLLGLPQERRSRAGKTI